MVLDEIAHEIPTHIAVGVDQPPPPSRIRAREAMDALSARILEVRPVYLSQSSSAEIENFATITDSLAVLTGNIEHLLDEPPQPHDVEVPKVAAQSTGALSGTNPLFPERGVCVVAGYVIGLFTQRADLSTILTTVLITALPTYGAALRKMILRIVGGIAGGAVSLLAIIIVTPNFETLLAFLLAVFIVFYVSAYSSLSSGRVAYAGKQMVRPSPWCSPA